MEKTIYLSRENFENKLENELTIIYYPHKKRRYYICRDIETHCKVIRVYVKD